ncbi:MAG: type II 3-dehydroquinate dehydratase [Deltaproteobacteria bacterium]|nr:MAG: type II 3-dehydroquinate dehydratase [Deltaproteobacteria bacterium]
MKILVIHGPNLNLLGSREQELYGRLTLPEINRQIKKTAKKIKVEVEIFQSNNEGELVTKIGKAKGKYQGLLINPAAYTHTSVALRDAILSVGIPAVEVHISNVYRREEFRRHSFISDIALGQVVGFGPGSYLLGLEGLVSYLKERSRIQGKRSTRTLESSNP